MISSRERNELSKDEITPEKTIHSIRALRVPEGHWHSRKGFFQKGFFNLGEIFYLGISFLYARAHAREVF
jgi:hypothetical protein